MLVNIEERGRFLAPSPFHVSFGFYVADYHIPPKRPGPGP